MPALDLVKKNKKRLEDELGVSGTPKEISKQIYNDPTKTRKFMDKYGSGGGTKNFTKKSESVYLNPDVAKKERERNAKKKRGDYI